jgi:hypothetical protein
MSYYSRLGRLPNSLGDVFAAERLVEEEVGYSDTTDPTAWL